MKPATTRAPTAWLLAAALFAPVLYAEPMPPPLLLAQAGSPDQLRDVRLIKTAYLYNFLKFVRWPDAQRAEIKVCIARDAELVRTAQNALRGKQVGELAVQVMGPDEDRGGACDLRYSARGAPAPGKPAELTVGEGRDFVDRGGMVAFVIIDDRVRFLVNLKALREAGLSADARLLTVAAEVLQ